MISPIVGWCLKNQTLNVISAMLAAGVFGWLMWHSHMRLSAMNGNSDGGFYAKGCWLFGFFHHLLHVTDEGWWFLKLTFFAGFMQMQNVLLIRFACLWSSALFKKIQKSTVWKQLRCIYCTYFLFTLVLLFSLFLSNMSTFLPIWVLWMILTTMFGPPQYHRPERLTSREVQEPKMKVPPLVLTISCGEFHS